MPNRRIYIILSIVLLAAWVGGLLLQIMDVDAAQYAAMGMEMLKNKSILQLYDGGTPYLDKPPLHIWLTALSFYTLGISDFTYRLPSFLASLLAVYSTYKLARLWYTKNIALWSALILASCQAFFLMNNDVKTDTLLMSFAVFAIWQLSAFLRRPRPAFLLLGFAGIGLAMLAKGPIGLILPAAAIGGDLILKRKWKEIFHWRWLLAIPVILIILSPMLFGLYEQCGWTGIRFFFWTQSFGRITGASTWNNDSGAFFFVHTFLWAFLPWTLCTLAAIFYSIKEVVKSRFRLGENQEGISLVGFILVFIALSMSHYKLPHYIFILFPLSAIFTARWIHDWWKTGLKIYRVLSRIQWGLYVLLILAVMVILCLVFKPVQPWVVLFIAAGAVPAIVVVAKSHSPGMAVVFPGVVCMALVNIGLNWGFYPRLIAYQATNNAGKAVAAYDGSGQIPFYYCNVDGSHSLNFYARRITPQLYIYRVKDTLKRHDILLYCNEQEFKNLQDSGCTIAPAGDGLPFSFQEYDGFTVQNLTLPFLNPATRPGTLKKMYLVHLAKSADADNNKR